MEEDKQQGKFGKKKHFKLIKITLLHIIDKYYERFGVIRLENTEITMEARLGIGFLGFRGAEYTLHPDIVMEIKENGNSDTVNKTIIVECETTENNLLKDEMRLTAYKLLRLKNNDGKKLMMYIAFPKKLKGKVKKPECFNDLWFFDIEKQEGSS